MLKREWNKPQVRSLDVTMTEATSDQLMDFVNWLLGHKDATTDQIFAKAKSDGIKIS